MNIYNAGQLATIIKQMAANDIADLGNDAVIKRGVIT